MILDVHVALFGSALWRLAVRRISKSVIISIIFVIFLLALTCSLSVGMPLRLSENDADINVEMHIGDTLEVTLKGNPTTGYMWEVASVDSSILRQVGKTEFKPDTKLLGAGGKIIMRFKAVGAGRTTLLLVYNRSFEKNIPPCKTYKVIIEVER